MTYDKFYNINLSYLREKLKESQNWLSAKPPSIYQLVFENPMPRDFRGLMVLFKGLRK